MRVLFLQRQPCIRALKYAVALRSACPELELCFAYQGMTLSGYYGSGDELFGAWWDLGNDARPARELQRVLDTFDPDVVHSHNLPDSLSALAIELVDGAIPVVHDIHDLQSLRATPYRDGFPEPADPLALERAAIEGASAVITVSPELVDVVEARYRLPAAALVVPNLALRRDLPTIPHAAVGTGGTGIVYQGTLAADGGHYDLRDIFRGMVSGGAELHVHPNRPAVEYQALAQAEAGLTLHSPLRPAELMGRLPRYRAGWAGFNTVLNHAHIDTVLPNKLFEYLASGLPVLTLGGHRAVGSPGTELEFAL